MNELGRFDAAKRAIGEANVFNHAPGKPAIHITGLEALRTFSIVTLRTTGLCGPLARSRRENLSSGRLGDAADLDVAHKNVFDHAAAPGVRFNAARGRGSGCPYCSLRRRRCARRPKSRCPSRLRRGRPSSRNFDDYSEGATRRLVVVPARFDGDAIVTCVEDAIFDQNILQDSGLHPSLFGPCETTVTPRTVTFVQSTG